MKDSWCSSLHYLGKKISGGAARNARISQSGGMDAIIEKVATQAATQAYNEATFAANSAKGGKITQLPKMVRLTA